MYSKARAVRGCANEITPPPGYGGSRFGKDGDDGIPSLREEEKCGLSDGKAPCTCETVSGEPEKNAVCRRPSPEKREKPLSCEPLGFLKRIDREELLIIGLILLLAGERAESDTLLMLILLLCI